MSCRENARECSNWPAVSVSERLENRDAWRHQRLDRMRISRYSEFMRNSTGVMWNVAGLLSLLFERLV